MKIALVQLKVRTKQTTEVVQFSPTVTFIHGPVGTGKSTVARLIDYCFGGRLERTPAIQQEFVAAELIANVGQYTVQFERGAHEMSSVRVTWSSTETEANSVSAPLDATTTPIYSDDVFNLSDLIFKLAGAQPIKVRKSKLDPDSPLVRLSFRDLLWYCYLEQDHLDSSFFQMEHPFKGLKSRDSMRFITGLHSEKMSELEGDLVRAMEEQRSKREAANQIRTFMSRFEMGTETALEAQTNRVEVELRQAISRREEIEQHRAQQTHFAEPLRQRLRELSNQIGDLRDALMDLEQQMEHKESLRSELLAAKVKSARAEQAAHVLEGVEFQRCPRCGASLASRTLPIDGCSLCGSSPAPTSEQPSLEMEALRRDLNERIDELADSLSRHRREQAKLQRALATVVELKRSMDQQLANELARYDSAYVASIRSADREVATLQERLASLQRLRELPQAIAALEREAGELQGRIDNLRSALEQERGRLRDADHRIRRIADAFLDTMLSVGFPGVFEEDEVRLDPRNWLPAVHHGQQAWNFYDAGSGGKKTLFNVCYGLAIHKVAAEEDLPLPSFLIIDSPTKNISEDEDPELVRSLYRVIYELASREGRKVQFLLIDSAFVEPEVEPPQFVHRRMAGTTDAPSLISYYAGP